MQSVTVKQLRLEPKDDKVHVCALTKPVVVSPELSAAWEGLWERAQKRLGVQASGCLTQAHNTF